MYLYSRLALSLVGDAAEDTEDLLHVKADSMIAIVSLIKEGSVVVLGVRDMERVLSRLMAAAACIDGLLDGRRGAIFIPSPCIDCKYLVSILKYSLMVPAQLKR
jgi:hypothetical protein